MSDTKDDKASATPVDSMIANRTTAADRRAEREASVVHAAEERAAAAEPSGIGAAPAGKIEASGAIVEDAARKLIDVSHPAVDNNPRAGTTAHQNRIDFNDPELGEGEAVTANLDK